MEYSLLGVLGGTLGLLVAAWSLDGLLTLLPGAMPPVGTIRIDGAVLGFALGITLLTGLVFGPFGLFVYAILRPPEYLDDTRERELELRMLEQRLEGDARCPFCKTAVKDDYLVCPHCMRRLREVCSSCHRPVEPGWRICPYCEKQIPQGQAVGLEIG